MIYIGSDHGGYQLKQKIKQWLRKWGESFEDLGNKTLDMADDYPQYALAVAEKVADEEKLNKSATIWRNRSKGILICRSAVGMVIAANKVKDVRAVAVADLKSSKHSREHNDANVLGLSGDWMSEAQAKDIVKVWLDSEFSHEKRHERRVDQIREKEYRCGCGSC